MPKFRWTQKDAKDCALSIASSAGEAFAIETPEVSIPDGYGGRDWEWRFETGTIWTEAGRAEMSVDISATFAHMYFRFDDPARAYECGLDYGGRLNRFSGKWNRWEAAPTALIVFGQGCVSDFYRVCEPNPDPVDVAAYAVKVAVKDAQWGAYLVEVRAALGMTE